MVVKFKLTRVNGNSYTWTMGQIPRSMEQISRIFIFCMFREFF